MALRVLIYNRLMQSKINPKILSLLALFWTRITVLSHIPDGYIVHNRFSVIGIRIVIKFHFCQCSIFRGIVFRNGAVT